MGINDIYHREREFFKVQHNKMKQYIDSSQLKELNPDKFRKLCILIGDQYHHNCTDKEINENFQNEHLTMYISILEKTNIGKMLEILMKDNCNCVDCSLRIIDEKIKGIFYGEPLCDSLWKAVKREL